MCNYLDIQQHLNFIIFFFFQGMSGDTLFSLHEPLGHSGKVPVEHLDYDFIEKCKDVKYLEKILQVLQ